MFWQRYSAFCESIGKKPNSVVAELGITSGSVTKWKNGTIPGGDKLLLIAQYFGCTTDFLLGISDQPTPTIRTVEEWEILFSNMKVTELLAILERLTQILKEKQAQADQES